MIKKYFKYILLTFTVMFLFQLDTFALSCDYVAPYDQLSGYKEIKISCKLSKSENTCYLDTENKNNKESILNWKNSNENITTFKAYDYVINNSKCPPYVVFVTESEINGYKIYAADSKNTASEISINAYNLTKKNYRIASSISNINDEDSQKAYKDIEDYTRVIESIIDNFKLSDCMENDKTITRIAECKKLVQSYKKNIATFKNNVQAYVDTNIVDKQDERLKKFYKTIQNWEVFLNTTEKELKKEQDKIDIEMGLGSGTSLTVTEKDTESAASKLLFLSDICEEDAGTMKVVRFIGYLLVIVKILIPIGLIIFGVINFSKAMLSGNDDSIKKNAYSFAWKIVFAIVIFVLPTVINFIVGLIDGATDGTEDYENCRNCIFDPKNCDIPNE